MNFLIITKTLYEKVGWFKVKLYFAHNFVKSNFPNKFLEVSRMFSNKIKFSKSKLLHNHEYKGIN